MPIDLYLVVGSAPCRAVRLAAAAIGVDLNLKNVDLKAGEHLKPEFIKVTYNFVKNEAYMDINANESLN